MKKKNYFRGIECGNAQIIHSKRANKEKLSWPVFLPWNAYGAALYCWTKPEIGKINPERLTIRKIEYILPCLVIVRGCW